ncbi:hypothetical protein [Deinococcus sp. LM3]|uniref:hypothetical protein n=1 Tax=Deinococcus sp. LM3 TaxID=1938608 RepID=UPI001180CE9E|nr:hypothetical protein [Deinococcus sp. LM3]
MKALLTRPLTLTLLTAALLTGCAGPTTPSPTPDPTPTPTPKVARVELNSASLLLEQGREGQMIQATAYDDQGRVLNVPITFESSNPAVIEVTASGAATARTVGSAQVTASVQGVHSAPGIAASGVLQSGVVSIPASKVLRAPTFAEGVTPFSVGSTYTVVLKDVAPTAGKLWFSRAPDGSPVQGRVLSSRAVPEGTEVTLEIVPLPTLFQQLQVDETVRVPSQDIEFTAQTRAAFDIRPLGDGQFEFRPRAQGVAPSGLQALAFNAGPFRCSGSLPEASVTLGRPTFTLNAGNPTFSLRLDLPLLGTKRLRVLYSANPSLRVTSGTHTLNANFNDKSLTCTMREAVEAHFETFGLGLVAKMRPGLHLGGSYGSGRRTLSAVGSARATVHMGFDCNSDSGCNNLSRADLGTVQGTVTLGGSGDLLRAAHNLEAGVFLDTTLAVGLVVTELDVLRFRSGYRAALDLASLDTQVNSGNGAGYRIGTFNDVDAFAAVRDIVNTLIGVNVSGLPEIHIEGPGVRSPVISSATRAGTTVTVQLDPARVNFFSVTSPFSLGYNVKAVQLLRRSATGSVTVLDSVTPTSGATTVTLPAPLLMPAGSELFVTVVPKVLDLMPVGTIRVN